MYRKFKKVVLGLPVHVRPSIFSSRILGSEALVYKSYFFQNSCSTEIHSTLDSHTNTVISHAFAYSWRWRRKPWQGLFYGSLPFSSINTALVCEDCNDFHYGDCPVHGPLQIIEDKPREENPDVSAAVASLPASLKISDSSIPGAGLGVFSTSEIPKGVQFGPYKGMKIGWENITEDRNTSYCWEVCFYEYLKNFINLTFFTGWILTIRCFFSTLLSIFFDVNGGQSFGPT